MIIFSLLALPPLQYRLLWNRLLVSIWLSQKESTTRDRKRLVEGAIGEEQASKWTFLARKLEEGRVYLRIRRCAIDQA